MEPLVRRDRDRPQPVRVALFLGVTPDRSVRVETLGLRSPGGLGRDSRLGGAEAAFAAGEPMPELLLAGLGTRPPLGPSGRWRRRRGVVYGFRRMPSTLERERVVALAGLR